MNDRELLEMAAKADGEDVEWHERGSYFYRKSCNWPAEKGFFNPMHDDGEALRLAVNLSLHVKVCRRMVLVEQRQLGDEVTERLLPDPLAATRRAIVRAAAEIGRAMP